MQAAAGGGRGLAGRSCLCERARAGSGAAVRGPPGLSRRRQRGLAPPPHGRAAPGAAQQVGSSRDSLGHWPVLREPASLQHRPPVRGAAGFPPQRRGRFAAGAAGEGGGDLRWQCWPRGRGAAPIPESRWWPRAATGWGRRGTVGGSGDRFPLSVV